MWNYYDLDHEKFLGEAHVRHPLEGAPGDPRAHSDFRAHPELIDQVLEDFVPHAQRPAVQRFYNLLRWLNGDNCCFESIDCQLRGMTEPPSGTKGPYRRLGRLAIIYRDLGRNVSWLDSCQALHRIELEVRRVSQGLDDGLLSYCRWPRHFPALRDHPEGDKGFAVVFGFAGFGDTDDAIFGNLDLVFRRLETALQATSRGVS